MKTTLTIKDDVAAFLVRLRRDRNGLTEMMAAAKQREPFRTRSVDLGQPRPADIDNTAEAPTIAEGQPLLLILIHADVGRRWLNRIGS